MEKSLREKIYEKIRENITRGKLTPGERLVEDRLAEEFKASRSPVREALRLLEAEGLITFERNRGISVTKLSIRQVDEIFELRSILESHAACLAAQKISKKGVARLIDIQAQCKLAAQNIDLPEWLKKNELFHKFFYEHCGNNILIQSIDNLKRRVYRYYFVTITVPWHFEIYLNHHEEIIQGCEKNDGEMVKKFTSQHMETIKLELTNQLKVRGVNY
jgi:DNA-binding GntR family transcriptional regulator